MENKSIGFVPTMGFLHNGHVSLIKKSKKKSDITIVSIFVNPTQFSPEEDLEKYPRNLKHDLKILKENKVDALFFPSKEEIYPENFQTYVEVTELTKILEGEFRPAHFKGVTTVVAILFNSVKPNYVFFGQKDAQQAFIIKQMVKDLKIDVKFFVCPIIRENDGLALSSRNIYLSERERKDALQLNKSLKFAEEMINKGERKTNAVIKKMKQIIHNAENYKLDYIQIVDSENFKTVKIMEENRKYYILIACRFGKTRLIDNKLLKVKS